ncbi:DUF4222 domain-containing protein [Jinshanibacter sp. LJY008]|uniref:DUF4222 domain-containing protein n=1 Tax=Limnobaculum eriocheiris TaxID=2897391 RepID=A0A9X1MUS9_9GAMM|nr:DUF4222 domain-containing protein [Limnobaculum eriocheiris]
MSCIPIVNQCYTDKHGHLVTVRSVVNSRVSFIREGYEFPCVQSVERFSEEFTIWKETDDVKR